MMFNVGSNPQNNPVLVEVAVHKAPFTDAGGYKSFSVYHQLLNIHSIMGKPTSNSKEMLSSSHLLVHYDERRTSFTPVMLLSMD